MENQELRTILYQFSQVLLMQKFKNSVINELVYMNTFLNQK